MITPMMVGTVAIYTGTCDTYPLTPVSPYNVHVYPQRRYCVHTAMNVTCPGIPDMQKCAVGEYKINRYSQYGAVPG